MLIMKEVKELKDNKKEIEVEVVYSDNLSFEEQIERVKKFNDIFVDIAAKYHIEKIKNDKKA